MLKFPAPYPNALFVCTHVRPEGHPKPCCGRRGGRELHDQLKETAKERGLEGRVRVLATSCLGGCEQGPLAVRYPDGELMLGIKSEDVGPILEGISAEPPADQ